MATTTKFWVGLAHYHDWLDLLEEYANIVDTSTGTIMRDALDLWVLSVAARLDALPPEDHEVAIKSGHTTGENFGTEL